jgi:hypothetical protein
MSLECPSRYFLYLIFYLSGVPGPITGEWQKHDAGMVREMVRSEMDSPFINLIPSCHCIEFLSAPIRALKTEGKL